MHAYLILGIKDEETFFESNDLYFFLALLSLRKFSYIYICTEIINLKLY